MAQSLNNSKEEKTTATSAWDEFLELAKDWPRISIGSGGEAAPTVPFSAAHLYKNSAMWRKTMEGSNGGSGDEFPKALLTQNRVDVATDLDFQRVWMYLNGFAGNDQLSDLSETGEQYLGYFGETHNPLPPKIREALKPLKQMLRDRHDVFSGVNEAVDVITKYTTAAIKKNDLKLRTNRRSDAAKRTLQQAGFHIENDPTTDEWWYVEYLLHGPKRARHE